MNTLHPPAADEAPADPQIVITRNLALPLPDGFGPLLVDEELDYRTGRVYYSIVKATRARGTFTISGAGFGDQAVPTTVRLVFGRERLNADYDRRWPTDRPMVNGLAVTDGGYFGDPAEWRSFKPRGNVNVYVRSGADSRAFAPGKTHLRAGWIVIALLGHYFEHPSRPALLTAGAEHDALMRLEHVRRMADSVRSEIADRQQETDRLAAELVRYNQLDLDLQALAGRYAQRTQRSTD